MLTTTCPLPILSGSPLLQASRTRAAAGSPNLSPSPAETQDKLGLIRQDIRSLQEKLPFPDVEESIGTFMSNAVVVMEEHREQVITLDRLR